MTSNDIQFDGTYYSDCVLIYLRFVDVRLVDAFVVYNVFVSGSQPTPVAAVRIFKQFQRVITVVKITILRVCVSMCVTTVNMEDTAYDSADLDYLESCVANVTTCRTVSAYSDESLPIDVTQESL